MPKPPGRPSTPTILNCPSSIAPGANAIEYSDDPVAVMTLVPSLTPPRGVTTFGPRVFPTPSSAADHAAQHADRPDRASRGLRDQPAISRRASPRPAGRLRHDVSRRGPPPGKSGRGE